MAHITTQDAQAWCEPTKLDVSPDLDSNLEASVTVQVLAKIAQVRDVSGWVDAASTPALVRSIIAMTYVSWIYRRTYAEDDSGSAYGSRLAQRADRLIEDILSGSVIIVEEPAESEALLLPTFYPNDASSAQTEPMNDQDTGWGGPAFSVGVIW